MEVHIYKLSGSKNTDIWERRFERHRSRNRTHRQEQPQRGHRPRENAAELLF